MQLIHEHTYFLTAGECNAQGRMPIWLIASRVIEVATEHANALGIGYANLIENGVGWVLSRLQIEIDNFPPINSTYTLKTWIESFNRMFSDRCFSITDAEGREFGRVRTAWVAIDMQTRTAADLTPYTHLAAPADITCPIGRMRKWPMIAEPLTDREYTFQFCDIDFNRHVNTVQYIKLILNQFPMEKYDNAAINRFEIAFLHECRYGETVHVVSDGTHVDIVKDGERPVMSMITFKDNN